jgi:hypothetical protein
MESHSVTVILKSYNINSNATSYLLLGDDFP